MATDTMDEALADDEALLLDAVQAAGELALHHFKRGVQAATKIDNTPVTEADLAVDKLLHDRLRLARSGYGWLSEETADNAERLDARRVWIIDPIDGTRAFIAGRPDWVISAGLVEDGEPLLGVLLNPVNAQLFIARRGGGASLDGAPLNIAGRDGIEGARLIVTKGLLNRRIWASPWPETEIVWANSIAYRLALIAAGHADAAFALSGKSEWDLAAAALLVQEAGGVVTDATGAALRFNQPVSRINGFVAASPGLHTQLIARTGPVAADGL
ncbi:MAG: 3'(2'),5'-bisphosphate nucleotidase CysQ [Rhodomicrobiaceae bacterium]